MICCGFLVGQIDRDLVDGMEMYIGMHFIGSPDKYLMQAIDTKQNKLSIKTSKTFSQYDDNKLIIDFNGLFTTINTNNSNYYERYRDGGEIFGLSIRFQFKQNNLYYDRSGNKLLLLSNIHYNNSVSNSNSNNNNVNGKQIKSKSSDWPNVYKLTNQTNIWFGYSNNIDNIDKIYINQFIIGCIDGFLVFDKLIKLDKKGNIDNFYNDCRRNNEIIESICNQYGSCRNKTNYIRFDHLILECSNEFSVKMNTANHCFPDLSNNDVGFFQSINMTVRLTNQSINQSFMEIVSKNNSLIKIYFNSYNQIILAIKHDKSINPSKHILYEISSNQIHILRIEFTESKSTFQISNGDFIKTLILPKLGPLKLTNVGQSLEVKIPRQVHNWIIILIMIISISCNILICILWIIYRIKKQSRNIPTSNIYEEQVEVNNLT